MLCSLPRHADGWDALFQHLVTALAVCCTLVPQHRYSMFTADMLYMYICTYCTVVCVRYMYMYVHTLPSASSCLWTISVSGTTSALCYVCTLCLDVQWVMCCVLCTLPINFHYVTWWAGAGHGPCCMIGIDV